MALIKPVYGPNYGQMLLEGIQAYRGIKQTQTETERAEKMRQADDAALAAQNDPQAMAQLAALDPNRAMQLQQMQQFEDQRFRRERAETAKEIEGKPLADQVAVLDSRIDMISNRGGDPSNTAGLRKMIVSGPEEYAKSQEIIKNARIQGEQEGFLKTPKPPSQTTLEKNLIAAGYTPGTPEFAQAAQKYLYKPRTAINLGGPGEEQKALAKSRVQSFDAVQARAQAAQDSITSLDVLDNIDVSTGKAEPMKQALAAWGKSVGINTDKLANVPAGEAFTAEAGRTVLNAMAAQKGPQTESDMRQIRTTVSGLGKDPRANAFINNSARAVAMRAVEQRDFYENFLQENETLKGASKAWNDYKRQVPMVARGLKTPDGLPVFYHQFESQVMGANPGVSRQDIIMEWNRMDKVALQERGEK